MATIRVVLVAALGVLALPALGGAQQRTPRTPSAAAPGDASLEGPVDDRIRAEVIFESINGVRTPRLIVLWRGQPNWIERPGTGLSMNGSGSSGESNSRSTAGGVTRTMTYSRASGAVRINDMPMGTVPRDSMRIVMVDRVDSVGGPPAIVAVNSRTAVFTASMTLRENLETIPAVRAFIH